MRNRGAKRNGTPQPVGGQAEHPRAVHWVFSDPDDPRLTIEPDVTVEVSAADYFAGRDPALEAALGGD